MRKRKQPFYECNQWEIWVCVSHQPTAHSKDYTCSVCGSSCVVFQGSYRAKTERKKKPSAGHHFHWQLQNKLKQRDAGTPLLPFPPLSFICSASAADSCSPLKKNLLGSAGLRRCWNGEGDISLHR